MWVERSREMALMVADDDINIAKCDLFGADVICVSKIQ